jgi:hypothetical protein
VTRSIRKWSDDTDAMLQDCFASTDWTMFWGSSNGIEECTTSVTCFINNCVDDIVPTVTVHTYSNQKPWITGNICGTLIRTLIGNLAIASDEPSNRQSVNTGLKCNPTTPASFQHSTQQTGCSLSQCQPFRHQSRKHYPPLRPVRSR